jgi:hypothetical protein
LNEQKCFKETRNTNAQILGRLERMLLGGFLCALCVLAVNAGQRFHREDAKDAKKTLRRAVALRLRCSVLIREIRGKKQGFSA